MRTEKTRLVLLGSDDLKNLQLNCVKTDTKGVIESAHIKRVELKENVKAFFPQGQSKVIYVFFSLEYGS